MSENKLDLDTELPLSDLTLTDDQKANYTKVYEAMQALRDPEVTIPMVADLTYEDFCKVDLKVGTIVSAERVPKKDKLLNLKVDFGEGSPRQVVAGIGATFTPESLIGGQYLFVTNLQARQVLKGLWSNGMILATGPDAERLTLVRPDNTVTNGAQFK